jgi:hypothetical protein
MQTENPRRYKALLQVARHSSAWQLSLAREFTRAAGEGRLQQVLLSLSERRIAGGCSAARDTLHQQAVQVPSTVRTTWSNLIHLNAHRGYRQHHIVFLHGVTQRAMRCALANLTVDWFESEPNPPNGSVLVMRRSSERDSGQRWSEQWSRLLHFHLPRPPPLPSVVHNMWP